MYKRSWLNIMNYKQPVIPAVVVPGMLKYFNVYEEASLIMYIFSIHGKRLDKIIPIYYPLLVLEAYNNRSFVLDGLNNENFRLKYVIPDLEYARSRIGNKVNLGTLNSLKRILRSYSKGSNSIHRELVLSRVISKKSIISEISEIISKCRYDAINGYIINVDGMDTVIKDIIAQVNEFLYLINKTAMDILEINEDLFYKSMQTIQDIKERHSKIHGRIDRSIFETQRMIKEKINLLSAKMVSELKSAEQRYQKIIDGIMIQIRTIDNEIHRLSKEQLAFGDKKRHSKLIKDLEFEREKLLAKVDELRRIFKKDLESIRDKYMRMIKSEQKRLELIEKEKDRVARDAARTINHLMGLYLEVKTISNSLLDKLYSYISRLEEITIITPRLGSAVYFLRIYLVQDTNGRFRYITPFRLARSYTRRNAYNIKYYWNIRKYLLSKKVFKEIIKIAKNNYSEIIKHDILGRISYTNAKNILYDLSQKYEELSDINPEYLDQVAPENK